MIAPQTISEDIWFYRYSTHLLVVQRIRDNAGRYLRTDSFKVFYRHVEPAVLAARKKRQRRSARTT